MHHKTKTFAVLSTAAALAGGCAMFTGVPRTAASLAPLAFDATYLPQPVAVSCTGAVCWIDVTVSSTESACTPKPAIPIVWVTDPAVRLVWQIRTKDYSWPSNRDGIVMSVPNPFPMCGRVAGDQWQCIARGQPGQGQKLHSYKIYVVEDRTGRLCILDPGVVTDW